MFWQPPSEEELKPRILKSRGNEPKSSYPGYCFDKYWIRNFKDPIAHQELKECCELAGPTDETVLVNTSKGAVSLKTDVYLRIKDLADAWIETEKHISSQLAKSKEFKRKRSRIRALNNR